MKLLLYHIFIVIFFIPLACIVFVLGGLDAWTGKEWVKKYWNIIEKIKAKIFEH